ncbi:MAG: hypothetical protein OEY80_01450 [Nitrospirota bacterium]|nr:hypothetical protein [Nitrospirota bacterium]MDH4361166.1 hypothetical protein [Nitrospirota bacterium]MDH5574128.1 hypothetical protein [Nitrospirota bacterium]
MSQKIQNTLLSNKQPILSVSLLNGRFKALSIINNSIHLGWEKPGMVVSPHMLRQALQEAIHHTEFSGTQIAMMFEDPRFISRTLQLPPMFLTDLLPILDRKVQQEKTCEGPAAWRYRMGLESRGKLNIHLEIWPQHFIDEIVQICQDFGLSLRQLAPLSALAENQLSTLPVKPGEGSLLVTMLEGKIMFIAGRDDGTLLWARHLFPVQDWVPLGERVATEANRTIMFITQQAKVTIPHIWFLGEEERLTVGEIQPHVTTPLLPFPINPDWKYWLWVGATLPVNHPSNFTPKQVLQAPLRNTLTKTLAAMIAVFIMLGVGTTSVIEGYLTKHHTAVQTITARVTALQQDQEQWKSRLMSLQTKRQWAQAVRETTVPELEGPFLSYLGTIIPPQIILQKAYLERTQDGWIMELDGSTSTNLSTTLLVVHQFAQQLAEGPYHVTLDEDWRDQLLTQTTTTTSSFTSATDRPLHRFTMKGTMS